MCTKLLMTLRLQTELFRFGEVNGTTDGARVNPSSKLNGS
jgi:hypothetical protein